MSILLAASYPERVTALIWGSAAARWFPADGYPCGDGTQEMFQSLWHIAEHQWGEGASIEWYLPSQAGSAHARRLFARFERLAISPSAFLRMLRMIREIDVRAVLPALHLPTLVIQRLDDRITPPCHGRYLASHITGARYFEQPGDHSLRFASSGDSDALYAAIAEFLDGTLEVSEPGRVLTTILVAGLPDGRGGVPDGGRVGLRDGAAGAPDGGGGVPDGGGGVPGGGVPDGGRVGLHVGAAGAPDGAAGTAAAGAPGIAPGVALGVGAGADSMNGLAGDAELVRRIRSHHGRVITASGNTVMATFEAPGLAVRCAAAMRDGAAASGNGLRAGVHTGEVDVVGGDVSGAAVRFAYSIAALARPGEILISRTVRDLVAGSGITVTDNDRCLSADGDNWPLFAVGGL